LIDLVTDQLSSLAEDIVILESFFGNFLSQVKILVTNDIACFVLYATVQFTLF
jgi:hypothetical protein